MARKKDLEQENKELKKKYQNNLKEIQKLEAEDLETKAKKLTRIFGDPIVDVEW